MLVSLPGNPRLHLLGRGGGEVPSGDGFAVLNLQTCILFLVSSLCLYFSLYCLYSSTHIYGKPLTCWPPSRVPQAINGDRGKTSDDLYKNRRGVHTSHIWEAFLQEVIFQMNWKKNGNLLSYARGSELWAGEQTLGSYLTSLSFGFLLWRTYLTTEWDSTCQVPRTEPDL